MQVGFVRAVFSVVLLVLTVSAFAQLPTQVQLEGTTTLADGGVPVERVRLTISDALSGLVYAEPVSADDGTFGASVPGGRDMIILARKPGFALAEQRVAGRSEGVDNEPITVPLRRSAGYLLQVSLREGGGAPNDSLATALLAGAKIEAYNNTSSAAVEVVKEAGQPYFAIELARGNHYTILIRADRHFAKRIDAYVEVDGCQLCLEGVDQSGSGMRGDEAIGTVLVNVGLEPVELDYAMALPNLYYAYDEYQLGDSSKRELDQVVDMLRINPAIQVEIGSHTDSQGDAEYNRRLSQKRAEVAVRYIADQGVDTLRLSAMGYGETEPANMCRDGVTCSEEEYAVNRRTELRVVGLNGDPFARENLADILAIERKGGLDRGPADHGEEMLPDATLVSTTSSERQLMEEAKNAYARGERTEQIEVKQPENLHPNSPELIASGESAPTGDSTGSAAVPAARPAKRRKPTRPLTSFAGDQSTGYRVLVFESSSALADENGELFFKFGGLKEQLLSDGSYGYFSDVFETEREARTYADQLESLFPRAKILRFENGQTTDPSVPPVPK